MTSKSLVVTREGTSLGRLSFKRCQDDGPFETVLLVVDTMERGSLSENVGRGKGQNKKLKELKYPKSIKGT
jgi:hypothetical protein